MSTLSVPSVDDLMDVDATTPRDHNARGALRGAVLKKLEMDAEIAGLDSRRAQLVDERNRLIHNHLPEMMDAAGVDREGYPDLGVDLISRPYFKANISAEWSEEKRQAAFDALQREGHGDIVKVELSVQFGRGDIERARALRDDLIDRGHQPRMQMRVDWNTLTALAKELHRRGQALPPECEAQVGRVAEIKTRKEEI
jgi:hypothetical protein